MTTLHEKLEMLRIDKDQYESGIFDLSQFAFSAKEEFDELRRWLQKVEQKKLNVLNLSQCHIAEEIFDGGRNRARSLSEKKPELYLSTGSTKTIPLALNSKAEALSELLKEFTHWKVLDLSGNYLSNDESAAILRALNKQENLLKLDLSENNLGNVSVYMLNILLHDPKNSRALKYLSLRQCGLQNSQLQQIAGSLKNNRHVRELDLRKNEVTNATLKVLLQMLDTNKTLVKIEWDTEHEDLDIALQREIEQKLSNNRIERGQLHKGLLSVEQRYEQARKAITADDREWLKLALGPEITSEEEDLQFNKENLIVFRNKRQAMFLYSIAEEQLRFLQKLSEETFSDHKLLAEAQHELQTLLKKCQDQEYSLVDEFLDRTALCVEGDKLITLTPEKKAIFKQQWMADVIEPSIQVMSITLQADTFQSLLATRKEEIKAFEARAEELTTQHGDLQKAHEKFKANYRKLTASLQALPWEDTVQKEWEEISEALVNGRLNPNQRKPAAHDSLNIAQGDTLLHTAFFENKPKCVELLLLQPGTNPLLKGENGKSVFYHAINDSSNRTACHDAVIRYIKETVDTLWPQIEVKETGDLKKFKKEVLDNYLDILLDRKKFSFFRQIITGVKKNLENRGDELVEYYAYLKLAYEHSEENPLNQVLQNMLNIAKAAKKGGLNQSELHKKVKQHIKPLLAQLNSNYIDYLERVKKARAIRTGGHSQDIKGETVTERRLKAELQQLGKNQQRENEVQEQRIQVALREQEERLRKEQEQRLQELLKAQEERSRREREQDRKEQEINLNKALAAQSQALMAEFMRAIAEMKGSNAPTRDQSKTMTEIKADSAELKLNITEEKQSETTIQLYWTEQARKRQDQGQKSEEIIEKTTGKLLETPYPQ